MNDARTVPPDRRFGARSFRRSFSSARSSCMWFRWIHAGVLAAQERQQQAESPKPNAIATRQRRARRAAETRSIPRSHDAQLIEQRAAARVATRARGDEHRRDARGRRTRRCATPRSKSIALAAARECGCATKWSSARCASRATRPQRRVDPATERRARRPLHRGRWEPRVVSEKLARRYAIADLLGRAANANAVERVGDDLAAVAAAIDAEPRWSPSSSSLRSSTARRERARAERERFEGRVDDDRAALAAPARAEAPRAAARRIVERVSQAAARRTRHGDARRSRRAQTARPTPS